MGVVLEQGRPLGAGELQLRSCVLYQPIADALLTTWLRDADGTDVPVLRRGSSHLPWRAAEWGDTPTGISVEATHVFVDERRLLTRFRFSVGAPGSSESQPSNTVTVRPRFLGQLSAHQNRSLRTFGIEETPVRTTWAESRANGLTGGLARQPQASAETDVDEPVVPEHAIRITALDQEVAVDIDDVPVWMMNEGSGDAGQAPVSATGAPLYYVLDLGEHAISIDSPLTVTFLTELSVSTYRHRTHQWLDTPVPEFAKAVANSRELFLDRVGWSRSADSVSPLRVHRYWRARWALLRTGYQGRGPAGEFGNGIASTCVPTSGGFTRAFFWDAFFSSVAISRFEPEFAKGAIRSQFVRQLPDGHNPEHVFNYMVEGRSTIGAPQAPVATWAVTEYLKQRPEDGEFLRSIYPTLVTNHKYWLDHGDRDGDGLAEWTWTGQTADSSPVWDEYRREDAHCNWIPPVASVQLNAFLYRDALLLADLAERLEQRDDAEFYRASASERERAFFEHCYLPAEKRFWDYYPPTRRHKRIRTFYMFWPLWAGMHVPEETRQDLVETELLNAQHFYSAVPFPSVAYSEPTYENRRRGAFWRGTSWTHMT
jgi:hypothetical protein